MSETHTHAWGTQPEMFGPRHEYRLAMFLRETGKLPKNSLFLDGAVGLGQLATKLIRQGHRVVGVDYSFDAAIHVRRTLGAPVVVGDLTKLPFRSGVFDAMTSGETLEHIPDDVAAVSEIGRVTKTGGIAVVTVPALESLRTSSDDYYEHLRRYSREQLVSTFDRAGFVAQRATFWGFPVVLVYDTLFLIPMNRRRAKSNVSDDTALQSIAKAGRSRLLVSAVKSIFSIDRLFSFVPFGPGLLYVGKKRRDAEAAKAAGTK